MITIYIYSFSSGRNEDVGGGSHDSWAKTEQFRKAYKRFNTYIKTMKQKVLIFGLAIIGVILISGCIQQPTDKLIKKGFLEGKVTIGPLCPVERFPPDPRCQPTEETYKSWPIAVWTADKKTKVAQIVPDLDGTYKLELPAGNYIVSLEKQVPFGLGAGNLPANIAITSEKTAILNIGIETGIR